MWRSFAVLAIAPGSIRLGQEEAAAVEPAAWL
jgi:hypothetical protein